MPNCSLIFDPFIAPWKVNMPFLGQLPEGTLLWRSRKVSEPAGNQVCLGLELIERITDPYGKKYLAFVQRDSIFQQDPATYYDPDNPAPAGSPFSGFAVPAADPVPVPGQLRDPFKTPDSCPDCGLPRPHELVQPQFSSTGSGGPGQALMTGGATVGPLGLKPDSGPDPPPGPSGPGSIGGGPFEPGRPPESPVDPPQPPQPDRITLGGKWNKAYPFIEPAPSPIKKIDGHYLGDAQGCLRYANILPPPGCCQPQGLFGSLGNISAEPVFRGLVAQYYDVGLNAFHAPYYDAPMNAGPPSQPQLGPNRCSWIDYPTNSRFPHTCKLPGQSAVSNPGSTRCLHWSNHPYNGGTLEPFPGTEYPMWQHPNCDPLPPVDGTVRWEGEFQITITLDEMTGWHGHLWDGPNVPLTLQAGAVGFQWQVWIFCHCTLGACAEVSPYECSEACCTCEGINPWTTIFGPSLPWAQTGFEPSFAPNYGVLAYPLGFLSIGMTYNMGLPCDPDAGMEQFSGVELTPDKLVGAHAFGRPIGLFCNGGPSPCPGIDVRGWAWGCGGDVPLPFGDCDQEVINSVPGLFDTGSQQLNFL